MGPKVNDAIFISTESSTFTLISPRLAARSRLDQGFRDDCIFGGRRTNNLGLKQETLAPVSQTAYNGISQTVNRMRTFLSSTTEIKRSVCWRPFELPAQLPR